MAAIIFCTGGAAYWQYRKNVLLHEQVATAEVKSIIQNESILAYSNNLAQTIQRLEFVQYENDIINSNATAKNAIFERHDLEALARKKSGLIEVRVNTGTQKALDAIETITDPQWKP